MIASSEGGMDIEAVAAATPEKIHHLPIDPTKGLSVANAEMMAEKIGFSGDAKKSAGAQFITLFKMFWSLDATLIEINPFAQLKNGQVMCLDAKFNLDSNAIFRHPDWAVLADKSQEDPRDVMAAEHDINYIGLSGNIGCLVNGAGLAMATMDLIKLHGGEPANFLDIGGGASEQQVTAAFTLLNADPQVKAILVNIFGGIMRCDIIAQGIVSACATLALTTPVVVRLQGTNFAEGKKIIEDSGLRLLVMDNLEQAAQQAVQVAKISEMAAKLKLRVKFEIPI
jgi:succinyl-CoA synthetase beta subunit